MKIMTINEAVMDYAERKSKEVAAKFLRSVRLVYGLSERGNPIGMASCILLMIDGHHIILTAAHAADITTSGKSPLYIAGENKLIKIEGEIYTTAAPDGNRAKDNMDFAFKILSTSEVSSLGDVDFIEANSVSMNQGSLEGRAFLALGYPCSKNKEASPRAKEIVSAAWNYQYIIPNSKEKIQDLQIDSAEHFTSHMENTSETTTGTKSMECHQKEQAGVH
ncbi:hypothetical protein [Cupriavidus sp. USMAA2-4]|uniref:hypothetical protein n=1 Tax=Cupriavidus sp. USMAA2-4 TaxID=876364 RepID=UPI0012F4B066|nr:hypothetical protein [Cupriavidus sp. USMAA2-4]